MKILKKFFIYIFVFFITINFANAGMILDKVILDFLPKDSSQKNIIVYNSDKEPIYIASEIFEILNAGEQNQERKIIDKKNRNRLVVAPSKLTINPDMRKRLQFINTDKILLKDKIYRVAITPKIAGIQKVDGLIGIKILIGYDVLVIIRPQNMNFDLNVKKGIDTITFKNNGNTNILLENIKQCDDVGKCQTILSDRLYAGNTLTATLIYKNKPVLAEMYYANEFKKDIY